MPDNSLEDLVKEDQSGGYGLARYLAAKRATQDQDLREQQIGQQQDFLQKRQALGPDATPEALIGLAQQYADPRTLLQYGQASLDRREAIKARVQQANELAQYRIDALEERRTNNVARLQDKEARDAMDAHYRQQTLDLQRFIANNNAELKKMGIDIQQQRADQQGAASKEKRDQPLVNMLDKIDATTRMIEQNPEAVGGRGMLGRGMEFIGGMVNPGQQTPASDLQTQILDLQTTYRGLPGHAASRLKIDAANVDKLIKGLGTFTSPDQALGSLRTLRATIAKQLGQEPAAEEASGVPSETQGTPQFPPAPLNPADRVDGVPYTTPKGVLKWNKKKGKWLSP